MNFRKWIIQLICSHTEQDFICNNCGERVGCCNSSTWKCSDCGKIICDDEIVQMNETLKSGGKVFRFKWKGIWQIKGLIILDKSI